MVYSTLQALNLIRYYEGQHIIDISNLPERLKVTATGPTISYTTTIQHTTAVAIICLHFCLSRKCLTHAYAQTPRDFKVVVDPSKLHWTPLHTSKKGRS